MWTVAGYLVLLLLLGLGGYELLQQKRENDGLVAQLIEAEERAAGLEGTAARHQRELGAVRLELQSIQAEAERLQREQQEARVAQQDLEAGMRAALASKDVTISELEGRLTLNILDHILFDSGNAVIKPEGEQVLRKVATVLEQFPDRQVHVTGHTDNMPIRTVQFPSNWELSSARALAAVRFLVEHCGTDPGRIAAVAHGEFQPVAENASADGRARNRRIAVVVLPEVFPPAKHTPPDSMPPTTPDEPAADTGGSGLPAVDHP